MTDQHRITPPPELMKQCMQEWLTVRPSLTPYDEWMFAKFARWGWQQRDANVPNELQVARDEELDACYEWLCTECYATTAARLRAARRPKPKSQAEEALNRCNDYMDPDGTIRAALERLRKLEDSNE